MEEHNPHHVRHEHHGLSSKGMFDDRSIMKKIGLKEGQSFFDGGCADGHFSITASCFVGESGKVYAVDIHKPSLQLLRQELKDKGLHNIEVMEQDLRKELPLEPSSIDHFFMSNVMHGFVYNGEVDEVFHNVEKILRKGGILSLIEWDKDHVVHGPQKEHRISFDDTVKHSEPYGLKPIKMEHISPEHVLMMFNKV